MRRHAFMRAQIRGIGFYKLSVVSLRVDIRSPLPCNRCVPCDRRTGCRASAKTQPASSSILSSTPEETKGRARFNTFEDAIAWNTKVQWSSRHLDPLCVDINAFVKLVRRYELTFSVNLWHHTCLLACLGIELPKIIKIISDPNVKYWVKSSITIEKLEYLHDVLGMERHALAKVCSIHRNILSYSLENTIKSRTEFFCEYFQVEPSELGPIAAKHPRMLWAHMELDIKAKIQLLNGVMGDPEDVVSMLRRQPHILAYSEVTIQHDPEDARKRNENVQEKLCALVELLELQPGDLAQILRRSPSLLNRHIDSLRPQLQTLLEHLHDPVLVNDTVRRYSQVLTYSSSTLDTKLKILVYEFGFHPRTIAKHPSLIGYSTELRMRPRVLKLKELLRLAQGRRKLTKSKAKMVASDNSKSERQLPRKKLSQGSPETAISQLNDLGPEEWLTKEEVGKVEEQGDLPESGVPGIREDASLLTYVFALTDKDFEKVLRRHEKRIARHGRRAS